MASKLSEHWQDGKSLQECNLHLMENEYSDITFRLHYKGESKEEKMADIPALRLLCLARSPVFYAMFNGELSKQQDSRVFDIHDEHADPQAFKQMVRFMYSDDVMLTADNVLAILYLSQKYIVSALTKRCLQFLEDRLTPDTALIVLEQSMLYDEKELKDKTIQTIEKEAAEVLASDEFMNISREVLGEVLQLQLKMKKEVTVFEACMKWAKNQCQKLNKPSSGENIREVLGDKLYLIRFPTMSLSEFTEAVVPHDVLKGKEIYKIMRHITSESDEPENLHLPFETEHRWNIDFASPRTIMIPPPYTECEMHDMRNDDEHTRSTSLTCTVSKPLRLKWIHVQTDLRPTSRYVRRHLTVTINQKGERLLNKHYWPHTSYDETSPKYYAVRGGDVLVEAGTIELIIELTLSVNMREFKKVWSGFYYTLPETHRLSDDYVTVTFPPTSKNLFIGFDYCIP